MKGTQKPLIHGPSVTIGAGISAAVLVAVFVGIEGISNEPELVVESAPLMRGSEPPIITIETFLDNGSPILGKADAPVTLVEFGDYQCHFCNVFFHSTEESIIRDYVDAGKVKMIFKDYNIIGPDSVTSSHGAHCASDQEMFWEYHDILYNNWTGENDGWASSENQLKFAQELGLNIEQWSECMEKGTHSQRILASNEDAKSLELGGTPAFFVIGSDEAIIPISGAQPYEVFVNAFEEKLEKSRN